MYSAFSLPGILRTIFLGNISLENLDPVGQILLRKCFLGKFHKKKIFGFVWIRFLHDFFRKLLFKIITSTGTILQKTQLMPAG